MYDNAAVGKVGENIALEYLLHRGQVLRDRNWRAGHHEIDLIMEDAGFVRFVEVKTLVAPAAFDPVEEITESKRKRMICGARTYAAIKGITKEMVFDVIGVELNTDGMANVTYIPDAFLAI